MLENLKRDEERGENEPRRHVSSLLWNPSGHPTLALSVPCLLRSLWFRRHYPVSAELFRFQTQPEIQQMFADASSLFNILSIVRLLEQFGFVFTTFLCWIALTCNEDFHFVNELHLYDETNFASDDEDKSLLDFDRREMRIRMELVRLNQIAIKTMEYFHCWTGILFQDSFFLFFETAHININFLL